MSRQVYTRTNRAVVGGSGTVGEGRNDGIAGPGAGRRQFLDQLQQKVDKDCAEHARKEQIKNEEKRREKFEKMERLAKLGTNWEYAGEGERLGEAEAGGGDGGGRLRLGPAAQVEETESQAQRQRRIQRLQQKLSQDCTVAAERERVENEKKLEARRATAEAEKQTATANNVIPGTGTGVFGGNGYRLGRN